jgi:RNA polymerase sigma factor (sigma-70 family)
LRSVIHIVDDDASFRTAVGRLLRESGYETLAYESAQQFLERLAVDSVLGCILLDVQIPDLSGPELQHHLTKQGSTLPVIFLTGHGDIPTSVKAIKAGAEDFLTKPVAKEQLLASIERAIARHERTRQQRDRVDALRRLVGTLTPRENEVFKLVILGKMNKQIAHELGTTERTIKAHRQRVMHKLQVQSLAELVSIGERIGVLSESASEPTKKSG